MAFKSELSRKIKEYRDKVVRGVGGGKRDTFAQVAELIIRRTPVSPLDSGHSGRARNNWVASIGDSNPIYREFGPFDPSGQPAIDSVRRVAESVPIVQAGFLARRFLLQNAAPYAVLLENGSSAQAPAGMVTLTLAEFDLLFSRNFKANFR